MGIGCDEIHEGLIGVLGTPGLGKGDEEELVVGQPSEYLGHDIQIRQFLLCALESSVCLLYPSYVRYVLSQRQSSIQVQSTPKHYNHKNNNHQHVRRGV